MTQMPLKCQFLKKNYMAQKSNLNTLLGMMIMISLDYYA